MQRDFPRRWALLTLSLAAAIMLASACQRGETPLPATPSITAQPAATATPADALSPLETPAATPETTPADALSPLDATPQIRDTEGADGSVYLPQVALGAGQAVTPTATVPAVAATAEITPSQPVATAPPPMQLADWPAMALQDWPRPANDNGMCMHNTAVAYLEEPEVDLQVSRLRDLNMRWTLVHYGDELQIMKAAPRYRDAGIMVVWRKNVRPYDRYYDWGRDVQMLLDLGVAPYMQIYNEPSLPAEWDERPIDQQLFLDNFAHAAQEVYNAGGYVGIQFVSDDWLRAALREIKARGGEQVFQRMFLVPHPYGLNHPPDYTADPNGVLGFLHQARIVEEEIGFVPPIIAGEGGWKWNATDDRNFPPIDAQLHRDYHVELFNWFRTGVLSNGEPLPDTLLAFCPWLLSDRGDDSAWFDSFAGDRTLTIEGVRAIPQFVRRFSWE